MIQGRALKVAGLCAMLLSLAGPAQAAPKVQAVPGEYVVRLKDTMSTMSLSTLSQTLGGEVVEKLSPQSNAILVRRNALEREDFVINSLKNNPYVANAEPNFIYTIDSTPSSMPNDPELSRLWGLVNTGQKDGSAEGVAGIDVDAKRAWEIETGSRDVLVAVIDTGVDYDIADLTPNMWANAGELNGTAGVDDDNNGFVDDIYGYDFANNDGDPKDDHGHGSHVSGTIGGMGNDGAGIVGVAWNVRIMGIKFLSAAGGGTLADAIKSIDYATQMGADIMSNSWGGGGFSEELKLAIERAHDAGILFTAAAGNSRQNNDANPTYPATYDVDNIISVAAIDNRGNLASFSCYGRTTVDVAAPGVNILSTTPNGLRSWSGTSMATPHVSGVAALVLSHEPGMSMADLRDRIINTARPLTRLRSKVASGGIVNAYHALTNTKAPSDPDDPFNWDKNTYDIKTSHPYADNFEQTWTVQVPGANRVSVYFSRFETERGYDKLTFKDAAGNVIDVWSGEYDASFSPVVEGDTVIMTFTSDESQNKHGFDVEAVAYQ